MRPGTTLVEVIMILEQLNVCDEASLRVCGQHTLGVMQIKFASATGMTLHGWKCVMPDR